MEERRFQPSEIGIAQDHITGHGIVFNSESRAYTSPEGHKVIEIIRPQAVEGLLSDPDIRAYHTHQKHLVLGRNTKTMVLTRDNKGVRYDVDVSGNVPTYVKDLMISIERGDVDTSSFGFFLPSDGTGVNIHHREDGFFVREIIRMSKIIDMSPMATVEAYPDTTASLRSVDDFAREAKVKGESYIKELHEMYKELF